MKKFSDLNIDTNDKNIFPVPAISIEDIINKEVEVHDFVSGVKTSHGPDRYLVKIKDGESFFKFFTNAAPIKKALDMIEKDCMPFTATVQIQKFGQGKKTYQFT